MSDDQLIERTLAGETEAFGVLVRRWESPIYGLSFRMLGRDEDARDVCQETFISAYRNLKKFRGDSKFSSWLYRIALNACHSRLRRAETGLTQPLENLTPEGVTVEYSDPAAEDVSEKLQRDQRATLVRRALLTLPPEMRQVILMKEYEDLTFNEIAEILEMPVSTVKSRLYTGLQQMRARLANVRDAL